MKLILKEKHVGFCFLMLSVFSFGQEKNIFQADLQDLFSRADVENRDLKILENLQKIAKISVEEERQKLLPTVETALSFSYNGNGWVSNRDFSNGMKAEIPAFGNQFSLEAKQLIYAGGAVKTSIEMSKMKQQMLALEKEKQSQNLRFLVAGFYLDMLKLQNQKIVVEKNILQAKKLIEQIKAKTNQGIALKNNITRYELLLQNLQLSLLQMNNQYTIINNELVQLLNLPVGTMIQPSGKEIALNELNASLVENSNEEILEKTPSLKQQNLEIEMSNRTEKLIKTEKLPQFFAFAGDYLNGPITIEIPAINKNFNYWYAGVGLKYDISSLYKNNVKLQQAKLQTTNAMEREMKLKEEISKQLTAAKIKYEETIEVYQTQLKNIELASQNYAVVKNRYLNDLSIITEMLDAENTKIEAELNASNAQINILYHYYQIKKILGTL